MIVSTHQYSGVLWLYLTFASAPFRWVYRPTRVRGNRLVGHTFDSSINDVVWRVAYSKRCHGATENAGLEMRYGEKSKGGKCRSGKCWSRSQGWKCRSTLAVWNSEPILCSDTALRYVLKIVFRLSSQQRVILLHFKIVVAFLFYSGNLLDAAFVTWCKVVVNIKCTGFKGYLYSDF